MRRDVRKQAIVVYQHWFGSRRQLHNYANVRQIISERNPAVNAFVHVTEPPKSQLPNLPLSGAPIALKDNIATSFAPTTCSSGILKDFRSPFDATVVKLLYHAGADIVGKTNCDEFGMGSLNTNSIHGPVFNPFQSSDSKETINGRKRSAGGSSGGSAAAVAAGMCYAALGTDTGGSIRLPASYCGVVGLKPSYGLISRWGVVSYADSLDCVGILAADVPKARNVFDVIAVHDEKDPTAASPELRRLASSEMSVRMSALNLSAEENSLKGLRIGVPQEYFPSEVSQVTLTHFRRMIDSVKSLGAAIIPVSLPSTSYALSAYYVLSSAEASSNMARYDGVQYGTRIHPPPGASLKKTSEIYAFTRSAGFGNEVQKRILLGTYALSADAYDNYFLQAQRVRELVKADFNGTFSIPNFLTGSRPHFNPSEGVDVLLHPSAIRTAPSLDDLTEMNGLNTYLQDVLTVPASLAGLPALSIPTEITKGGWPVGISIVGQWGCDEMVMKVGEVIHKSYDSTL